jgi:hypothetical protein
VTALAAIGPLVLAAEGPRLLFYKSQGSKRFALLGTKRVFADQAIHGVAVHGGNSEYAILAIWGGALVRFIILRHDVYKISDIDPVIFDDCLTLSAISRASDWILDLSFAPADSVDLLTGKSVICAAVTAHNALVELSIEVSEIDLSSR